MFAKRYLFFMGVVLLAATLLFTALGSRYVVPSVLTVPIDLLAPSYDPQAFPGSRSMSEGTLIYDNKVTTEQTLKLEFRYTRLLYWPTTHPTFCQDLGELTESTSIHVGSSSFEIVPKGGIATQPAGTQLPTRFLWEAHPRRTGHVTLRVNLNDLLVSPYDAEDLDYPVTPNCPYTENPFSVNDVPWDLDESRIVVLDVEVVNFLGLSKRTFWFVVLLGSVVSLFAMSPHTRDILQAWWHRKRVES